MACENRTDFSCSGELDVEPRFRGWRVGDVKPGVRSSKRLLPDLCTLDSYFRQHSPHRFHERGRPAKEKYLALYAGNCLGNEVAVDVATRTRPLRIGLR